ncbi:unnamed protein product, partial [Rotaria sordida]
ILLAQDLNDDNPSSFLPSYSSVNNDGTCSETTSGNTSSELFRLSSDEQRDMLAIIDNGQRMPNSTFDQNPSVTNMMMPQETIENRNVFMYQMYPSIFEMIDIAMSVKQQPKIRNLQRIVLAKNQTLGIVTTIVTSTNNPKGQTFVHANDITYRDSDAIKIAYGCVFVPLRQSNDVKE